MYRHLRKGPSPLCILLGKRDIKKNYFFNFNEIHPTAIWLQSDLSLASVKLTCCMQHGRTEETLLCVTCEWSFVMIIIIMWYIRLRTFLANRIGRRMQCRLVTFSYSHILHFYCLVHWVSHIWLVMGVWLVMEFPQISHAMTYQLWGGKWEI